MKKQGFISYAIAALVLVSLAVSLVGTATVFEATRHVSESGNNKIEVSQAPLPLTKDAEVGLIVRQGGERQ